MFYWVPLILEGHETGNDQSPLVDASIVTPEYFHLLGMTLLRGRLLGDFDNEKAPGVAVINEALAQTYWPNEDPLGKHLKLSPSESSWATVIGIVADARTESCGKSNQDRLHPYASTRFLQLPEVRTSGQRLQCLSPTCSTSHA